MAFDLSNIDKITSIDQVMDVVNGYIKNPDDRKFVIKAFEFASSMHKDQKRNSGDPYIYHCLSVSYMLALYESAPATLAAGFLHDVMEDCGVSYADLKENFNEDVAQIVSAVTKIKNLPNVSLEETSASTHRKLILAMAKDIRAVIVKLCDRLHNMKTLQYMSKEKQLRVSKETIDIYAPLAHRLGMGKLKNELENLSLLYLNPIEYGIVNDLVTQKLAKAKTNIDMIIESIKGHLDQNKFQYRIFGRTKHLYSVYKKMYKKHTPFEKIFDLMAVRIVTQTKLQCYEILGIIHDIFKPLPGRFKDYIAMPKTNMYQSLHTTVMDDKGNLFEIQIRTEEMDVVAERGIAAHWIYKESMGQNISKAQELSEQQLSWLRDLIVINEESADDSDVDYMKQVQKDLFETSIYVLTPKGKIIDMPTGSTPIDFAYRVHSEVGNHCTGAIVNNMMVPLNTELCSGDIVEVKTSKSLPGPSEDWLDFVKTNLAKSQIKKHLIKKVENKDEAIEKENFIEKGKRYFEDGLKEKFLNIDEAYEQLDMPSILNQLNVSTKNDLFIAIAKKQITVSSVILKLFSENMNIESQIDEINKKGYTYKKTKSNGNIIIAGDTKGIKIETAVCCKPLPGDPIVGFITRGNGIKVHKVSCLNIANETHRLIPASWDLEVESDSLYPVDLDIYSYDRHNLVVDLMGLINSLDIRIDSISARSHYETKTANLSCTVHVKNLDSLTVLISKIKSITGVIEVNRIMR